MKNNTSKINIDQEIISSIQTLYPNDTPENIEKYKQNAIQYLSTLPKDKNDAGKLFYVNFYIYREKIKTLSYYNKIAEAYKNNEQAKLWLDTIPEIQTLFFNNIHQGKPLDYALEQSEKELDTYIIFKFVYPQIDEKYFQLRNNIRLEEIDASKLSALANKCHTNTLDGISFDIESELIKISNEIKQEKLRSELQNLIKTLGYTQDSNNQWISTANNYDTEIKTLGDKIATKLNEETVIEESGLAEYENELVLSKESLNKNITGNSNYQKFSEKWKTPKNKQELEKFKDTFITNFLIGKYNFKNDFEKQFASFIKTYSSELKENIHTNSHYLMYFEIATDRASELKQQLETPDELTDPVDIQETLQQAYLREELSLVLIADGWQRPTDPGTDWSKPQKSYGLFTSISSANETASDKIARLLSDSSQPIDPKEAKELISELNEISIGKNKELTTATNDALKRLHITKPRERRLFEKRADSKYVALSDEHIAIQIDSHGRYTSLLNGLNKVPLGFAYQPNQEVFRLANFVLCASQYRDDAAEKLAQYILLNRIESSDENLINEVKRCKFFDETVSNSPILRNYFTPPKALNALTSTFLNSAESIANRGLHMAYPKANHKFDTKFGHQEKYLCEMSDMYHQEFIAIKEGVQLDAIRIMQASQTPSSAQRALVILVNGNGQTMHASIKQNTPQNLYNALKNKLDADTNLELLVLNERSVGNSSGTIKNMDEVIDDLTDVINREVSKNGFRYSDVTLVGHSMGGALAIKSAAKIQKQQAKKGDPDNIPCLFVSRTFSSTLAFIDPSLASKLNGSLASKSIGALTGVNIETTSDFLRYDKNKSFAFNVITDTVILLDASLAQATGGRENVKFIDLKYAAISDERTGGGHNIDLNEIHSDCIATNQIDPIAIIAGFINSQAIYKPDPNHPAPIQTF